MADLALNILLSAQDTSASSVIGHVGSAIQSLASGNIIGSLTIVGAALTGIGVASIKLAGDFQAGVTTLVTGAGESVKNIDMIKQGMLDMSTATGTSTKQLVAGMFMIESAGFHGADALKVLQSAAQGAKVGNADLGVTANAVTTIMNDYGMKADQAATATNGLIATVANGKTTMNLLATSLSNVLPTAAAAHVGLTDVEAAMATMTGEGVPAANAATYLRQTIMALEAPSAKTTTALKGVGLTTAQVSTEMQRSLPGALQMITDAVGKKFPVGSAQYVAALANISGGSKQMQAMLDLTGSHMKTFQDNVVNVSNAVKQGGNSITGWSQVQGDFNTQMDRLKASFDALLITIGSQFLPLLTPVVAGLSNIIAAFSQVGTAASPLSQLFIGMANSWKELADMVNVSGIISAFKQFGSAVQGSFQQITPMLLAFINNLNNMFIHIAAAVSTWIVPAITIARQVFTGLMSGLQPVLVAISSNLIPAIQNLVAAIAPVVQGILQWVASSGIIPIIMTAVSIAIQIVVNVVSVLTNILAALITFFTQNALGVAIFRAVLVILAVAIGIIGIVILSVVIPAFIAWVAGAIAVGIANLIAFAPIILIVLAIIAVVTIVVLVITHWGEIAHWLQGVWSAVAAWFMSVMSAIGSFFVGVWNGIAGFFVGIWNRIIGFFHGAGNGVSSWWTGLWQGIQSGLQAAWNFIVNIVRVGAQILFLVIFGPIVAIVNLFNWLYQHNYYFKALVDSIRNFFVGLFNWVVNAWHVVVNAIVAAWQWLASTASSVWHTVTSAISTAVSAVVSWLQSAWQAVISWLGAAWKAIAGVATSVWNAITSAISTAVSAAVSWLQGVWNNVISWLTGVWNNLVKAATKLWVEISSVFSVAWDTYIAKPVQTIWDNLTKWASGLVTAALSWGKNLIQGFINGIMGMLGAVGNAASSVVSTIGKFLGFHSPTQLGPGAQADTWAPNFIQMFSKGLNDGTTDVAKSSQLLITQMQQTLQNGFTLLNATVLQGVTKMTQTLTASWTQMTTATQLGMTQLQTTMTQGWTLISQNLTLNTTQITTQFTLWWTQINTLFTTQFTLLTTTITLWWTNTKTLYLTQSNLLYTSVLVTWWQKIQLLWTQQDQLLFTAWTNWWKQINTLWTQQWLLLFQMVQQNMQKILQYIVSQQGPITTAFVTPFKNAQTQIASIMAAILANVTSTVSSIISQLNSIQAAAAAATTAVNSVPSAPTGGGSRPIAGSFASGIENFAGGLAYVHGGEVLANLAPGTSVIPANRVGLGGGTHVHNIVITIPRGRNDARQIADEVDKILRQRYKSQLGTISTGGTSL